MCFFLISKYICDPAPGGVVEGGGPEGVSPPGTAAVSKHETKSVAQHQGAWSRGGGPGGVSPPTTAAVSKYETGYCDKARHRLLCQLCPSTRHVL